MNDLARAQEALRLYLAGGDKNYRQICNLIMQGVDVTATNNNKHTLLYWTALYEHLDVCAELIRQGADGWEKLFLYLHHLM